MKAFFKTLFQGPKHWSEWHGFFVFLAFAGPLSVAFAAWMVPDRSMLEPRYAGVVQSIQKSVDGGDVYSEIRTDLNSVILDKEYKDLAADKGDSLFFVLNQPGAGESVCVGRSRNHCARIMRNGILKGNLPHLQAHLDSATGCQYLVAPNGSLAPRMDSTGKQACK